MTIPNYFEPYEDELLYSWYARLAEANGIVLCTNEQRRYSLDKSKEYRYVPYSPTGLFWTGAKYNPFPDPAELLFRHTPFPALSGDVQDFKHYYENYMIARWVQSVMYNKPEEDPDYNVPFLGLNKMFLRVCPECMKEDAQNGLMPHLKVWHHCKNTICCAKHAVPLIKINSMNWSQMQTERLQIKDDSLAIARDYYNYYEKYRDLSHVQESSYRADERLQETIPDSSILVLHAEGIFVKAKCKLCGLEFWTTRHGLEVGRRCPLCEQNVLAYQLSLIDGYEITKEINNLSDKNIIKCSGCGTELHYSLSSFIWNKKRCVCSYRITEEYLLDHYNFKEFELLEAKYIKDKHTQVKIRHKKCGSIIERRLRKVKTNFYCPVCKNKLRSDEADRQFMNRKREKGKERFLNRMHDLVGDNYVLVSDYVDVKTSVDLLHKTCGQVSPMLPRYFLDGKRCSCENIIGSRENAEKALKSFVQDFTIISRPRTGYSCYVIRFDDGRETKLKPIQIIQEATCLCEPRYFKRK